MPKVTFTSFGGNSRIVDAQPGESIMKAAARNGVEGIVGECGGVLSCATCHIFVNDNDLDKLPPISDLEEEMLEGAAVDRTGCSRLSCQIPMTEDLDGLTVTTPEYQL